METKRLEFYKNFEKELINKNKKNDNKFKKLLNKKNFLNNQNYIISKYIKDRVIQDYNLYEHSNYIEEKNDFHKVRYNKSLNRETSMIINLIISLLFIGSLGFFFIIESFMHKTVPGILLFLPIIFGFILAIRVGGSFSEKTNSQYVFYRNKSDIYYKLK